MAWYSPLKAIASIAQFIPGPQQPFIAGASGIMHGIDAGRALKNRKYKSALFNTLGATGIPGVKKIPGVGELQNLYNRIPGPVRRGGLSILRNYDSMRQPFRGGGGVRGGGGGSSFFLRPTVPLAEGGIAGIPRLPDDFEGYVDSPHLVSLGERGTEVVVPLWKLMRQTRGR